MEKLPGIDIAVLVAYLVAIVAMGCWFIGRSGTTSQFMAAGRSLPGWALGLSIFGSYISSISFLANPSKAFASNWNAFAFSLATPIAALVAVRWFVPFYRRNGEVSAYEHLERRFGPWARTYAVICFLLTQMARMGTIIYLLALAVSPLVGWDIKLIIVLTGGLMTPYPAVGGMQAVVWTGVLQSLVLVAGPVVCLIALIWMVPGGLGGIWKVAVANHKFGLGSFGPSLREPTFWVVFVYGLVINLGNFGIDQSYVQRYMTARDDREAGKSVWLAAVLYVPTAAAFFFIGTALYALWMARPDVLAGPFDLAKQPDMVFPHFISHALLPGLGGLVVAGIFAASMDSNLNSMATLTLCDIYKRYVRPVAGERESMMVLYTATLGWGVAGIGVALAMTRARLALDVWWEMASIFSGGMLGLFLLGLISRRAGNPAAMTGVTIGILVILWMTLSPKKGWPESLVAMRSPFHGFMISVIGTLVILLVGLVVGGGGRATGSRGVERVGVDEKGRRP